ncbi:hypothetical protein NLG97_g4995 [Lecanicillium saksenae]|uniref:Uncharacterized protein n=1 Tax=Lecanicillium saksenae TaxID=468837 RepID=A0ACC1QVK5_9HYPO|nr:hypothetical protein NLG97_g4995 [Lecanicillium saksenae]
MATLSMLTDRTTLEDIYFSTSELTHINEVYRIPFEVLLEQATPSPRRLFISDMTASFFELRNELFNSGVRRLSTFGVSNFFNFALGDVGNGTPLQILGCLCYNISIQQLSVAVDSNCLNLWDFKEEKDFSRFCMYLGTMENLRVLWIIGNTVHKSASSLDHIQRRNMMDVLRNLVAFCPLLNYIKISNLAWRVVPAALGSERDFEALDAREDEVGCPQSLYVPSPLPGAKFSGHSDWRLIDWNDSI